MRTHIVVEVLMAAFALVVCVLFSFAVLLYNISDKLLIEKKLKQHFPEFDEMLAIYDSIGNYLKLADLELRQHPRSPGPGTRLWRARRSRWSSS